MSQLQGCYFCFFALNLKNLCSLEQKFAELDQNTSAEERERIRIDFWDWIVQSHGIPALNDDEIEYLFILSLTVPIFTPGWREAL